MEFEEFKTVRALSIGCGNNNNDAVEPILTANSPQWPPLYNAFFFSR